MIVFHLITSLDKGGAESHLYSLIKKQVQNKLSIYVFYLRGNDYWKRHLNNMGVKVFKLNVKNNFDFVGLLKAFINMQYYIIKFKPKVVHAHLSTMEFLGAFLKLKLSKRFKFIITKHLDSFFLEASFGRKSFLRGIYIDKFIISQADKIICISNQVKKFFSKEITQKNKYKTIYYGFSNKEFIHSPNIGVKLNSLRNKYNLKKNEIVLLNVARHVKQKSLKILLKAFSIYSKKQDKAKLILVGKGRETDNLKKLAIELNINSRICWIKNYENIKDIFLLSNSFVLTSEYEGLGLVLLEAMSSKTPIIASKSSAIPEVIKNNFNGYLFKKNNFKNLADKLFLIENKKTQEKFKKNGLIFLKEKFNLDKMNKMTTKIYNS